MDDGELANWQGLREAADENALCIYVGGPDPAVRQRVEAALATHPSFVGGLNGMLQIHRRRLDQSRDPEWRSAHAAACEFYGEEMRGAREDLDELLRSSPLASRGGSVGRSAVSLAERLGGTYGLDTGSLLRDFRTLRRAHACEGVRIVGRRLLTAVRCELTAMRRWRLQWHCARSEVAEESMAILRGMWECAETTHHRSEVAHIIELRAVDAVIHSDGDECYQCQALQLGVVGEPFPPWLEVLLDQEVADSLGRDLDVLEYDDSAQNGP